MRSIIKPAAERRANRWNVAFLTALAIIGSSTLASAKVHAAAAAGKAAAGKAIYAKQGCAACHKIGGKGGKVGPDLSNAGSKKHTAAWLVAFFKSPNSKFPKGTMPAVTASQKDLQDLAAYMMTLKK